MFSRLNRFSFILLAFLLFLSIFGSPLQAQDKPKDPPPASVSVSVVKTGMVAPQAEFIGTVFYQEVSDVASELSGLVELVRFEEGQRIKKGWILVELGSELLTKRLEATTSSYEQVLSELEIAKIDFKRKETLFKKQSISEQSYDENRFRVIGLEKRAASLRAEVEGIKIELRKKNIKAPFDGIVIKREVDRGEWISEGDTVAVLAKDDVVDIVADLPEKFLQYIKTGMRIQATVNAKDIKGTVIAIVPRGDVATRTFPVKIRTPNSLSLIEGMSAKVILPTGERKKTLVVPRDAVISVFGQSVIYVVKESKANMIPVKVTGYDGLFAGIEARGLEEGMEVVVEGNERLRNGQMVSLRRQEDKKNK